jgi:hypothetical protein
MLYLRFLSVLFEKIFDEAKKYIIYELELERYLDKFKTYYDEQKEYVS